MAELSDIAFYVTDKISSESIAIEEYVTTDNILQNKVGRTIATNLPPNPCSLTLFHKGDVLVANIRPYLKKIWKADKIGGASNDVLVFRAKSGHNPDFLYSVLLQDSFFDHCMKGAEGAKMPRGNKTNILRFPVSSLTLDQECSIGSFISNIDKKIELNRQTNCDLEAMAKQIYDYWFVQFDFPDEEGKPYKSSGGKMVWNETFKREIPEKWSVVQLSKIVKQEKSGDWGNDTAEKGYNHKVSCIRGADFKDTNNIPVRYIQEKNSIKELSPYDIVVEISGGSPTQATGRCLYITKELVDHYDGHIICSNFCQPLTCKTEADALYMYYTWCLIYNNNNMFHYEGKTSGIKNFQMDSFLSEFWILPDKYTLNRFREIVSPLMSDISKNNFLNKNLQNQREFMLPLLMNGQVSIKD